MSARIIQFPNSRVDRGVVQMLEHQLALAKEGKVSFFAFAALNDQGIGYSGWAPYEFNHQAKLTSAIGSVSFLKARFDEAVLDGASDGVPDEDDSA